MPINPPAEQFPNWEETPTEAARADDRYWDIDRDWPTDPDDPSDHYSY